MYIMSLQLDENKSFENLLMRNKNKQVKKDKN